MGFDDRSANRKPHTHAAGLGREEGFEDSIRVGRIDARARVLDSDHDAASLGGP